MCGQGDSKRTWRATRWRVVAALIVGVAGVPSPADAATSWWTDNQELGDDGDVQDLAVTHDGRPFLVEVSNVSGDVRARLQAANGSWLPPTTLVPTTRARVHAEAVVTAEATYVVWTGLNRGAGAYEIGASRLVGSTWTPMPALVADEADGFAATADADGDLVVAWLPTEPGSGPRLRFATFDGTSWDELVPEDDASSIGVAEMLTTEDGTIVMVGGRTDPVDGWGLYGVTLDDDGLSPPHRLSSPGVPYAEPHAEMVDAASGVVVAFFEGQLPHGNGNIRTVTFAGGSWSPPTDLVGPVLHPAGPGLAVSEQGSAVVAVGLNHGWFDRVEIVTYRQTSATSWTGGESIGEVSDLRWPVDAELDLSIGSDGTGVLTAEVGDSYASMVFLAVVRGPGRPWQEPIVLDDIGWNITGTQHLVDPEGLLHVVWCSNGWKAVSGFVVPFDDLVPGAFYSWPVLWAADAGLTTGVGGTDEFQPNRSITRAEAITTLWRYAGSPPAPAAGFSDTAANAFYSPAVNRARHTGLTTGVAGSNRFEPNRTITRAELVTLLWRFDGSKGAPSGGFADVPSNAFFAPAVNWAKSVGITTGVGGTNRFEPNREVTRAEAFTFVYRLAASVGISLAAAEQPPLDPFGLAPAEPLD